MDAYPVKKSFDRHNHKDMANPANNRSYVARRYGQYNILYNSHSEDNIRVKQIPNDKKDHVRLIQYTYLYKTQDIEEINASRESIYFYLDP